MRSRGRQLVINAVAALVVVVIFIAFHAAVIGGLAAFMHFTGWAYVQIGTDGDRRDPDRLW